MSLAEATLLSFKGHGRELISGDGMRTFFCSALCFGLPNRSTELMKPVNEILGFPKLTLIKIRLSINSLLTEQAVLGLKIQTVWLICASVLVRPPLQKSITSSYVSYVKSISCCLTRIVRADLENAASAIINLEIFTILRALHSLSY